MKLLSTLFIILFVSNFALADDRQPQSRTQNVQAPAKKRVGTVVPEEKEKYRTRYEAKDSRYFSLGPGFASNMNNSNMLYSFTFGYEWEVGAQGALLAEAFGAFGDGTAYGDGGIGGKYFFTDEDTSVFAKATFGMGAASVKNADSVSGFAGKVGLGLTFFRTSTKHLEISGNYATIFKSSKAGTPGVFVFALTLLY